jgi:hypothetical protein
MNVDWKVCVAATAAIVLLVMMLFKCYPVLKRIEASVAPRVVAPSEAPKDRKKPEKPRESEFDFES